MAKRRSGNVTVSISYLDSKSQYRAIVHADGKKKVIYVRPPAHLTRAVDSPAEYDSAGTGYVLRRIGGGKRKGK